MELRLWNLSSHSETANHCGIVDSPKRDDWREFHYTPKGEIECRVLDADSHTKQECESAMRARFPTFNEFLAALPQRMDGTLDLRGCALPPGLTLPQTVHSFDLSGCTLPPDLTMPQTVRTLDLRDCVIPPGLTMPQTVHYLDLSGCTLPPGLTMPKVTGKIYH